MLRNGHVRFGGRAAKTTGRKAGGALLPDPCTYLATGEGRLYLCAIRDGCSRRVLGWTVEDHMRTDLVEAALRRVVTLRGELPGQVIFPADRGPHHTSEQIATVCADLPVLRSMGRTGVCWDKAAAESFWSTLKTEFFNRRPWRSARRGEPHTGTDQSWLVAQQGLSGAWSRWHHQGDRTTAVLCHPTCRRCHRTCQHPGTSLVRHPSFCSTCRCLAHHVTRGRPARRRTGTSPVREFFAWSGQRTFQGCRGSRHRRSKTSQTGRTPT